MQPDPVSYATVPIDGKDYELRYRHRDIVQLKKDCDVDFGAQFSGSQLMEHLPAIIAAGLAHHTELSSQTVIEYISDLEIGELAVYTLAFAEAQKKASPRATLAALRLNDMAEEAKRLRASRSQLAAVN